jgi:ferrous-iron efflux pump FieF
MHIELDPEMRLARAHAVADAVELDIRAAYPHAEIIIHQDPAGEMEAHRAVAVP